MAIKAIVPVNAILGGRRNASKIIQNVLTEASEGARADFEVTTQTWEQRPEVQVQTLRMGTKIVKVVFIHDRIYYFLAYGTRVRYATMTPNFRAKTAPGQIMSRQGRGGVAFISRNRPRPGIVARRWPDKIARKWKRQLPRLFDRALRYAARTAR